MLNLKYSLHPSGDSACSIVFGDRIDTAINETVLLVFRYLQSLQQEFITDLVPSYAALTVFYDPVVVLQHPGSVETSYDLVCTYLDEQLRNINVSEQGVPNRTIKIPVCYSGEYAPDLSMFSASLQLASKEIIRLHQSLPYRVYMIGFQPGFAYMGEIDEQIAFPRKNKPARLVAAGSVGIAGRQTGIYPFDSPGGWTIIGRTPVSIFNKNATDPVLFQPGDSVTFYSITEHEFENYKSGNS